jgi:hypothetical protein
LFEVPPQFCFETKLGRDKYRDFAKFPSESAKIFTSERFLRHFFQKKWQKKKKKDYLF